MKNKTILLAIILLILNSCASKKIITEYKDRIVKDSIYITNDRYITKQINDTIVVNSVCDSLGNLKDFDRQILSNNVKVSLKSIKGDIQVTVDIDSIVNSKITKFKQNYKVVKEIKEVKITKYKTPLYLWMLIIIEGLIIFLLIRFK
jgi:predicted acyltransferase (DUF342 family)